MDALRCVARFTGAAGLLFLPLVLPLVQGRSYRLNSLPGLIASADVLSADTSRDGHWIVYLANVGGFNNLYSVPADGSAAPRALSNNTTPGLSLVQPTISPDSTRVLYLMGTSPYRMFNAPIDASSAPLDLVGAHVTLFSVTPDSARVVFLGDVQTSGRFQLWSIPIGGGTLLEESAPILAGGGDVHQFLLTSDGTHAVYRGDTNVNFRNDLFSAPLGPVGGALQLNLLPSLDLDARFLLTADGARVVYRANQTGIFELFSAPVDGSASAVRINTPMGMSVPDDFSLSPDGLHAIYRMSVSATEVQLFSVPVDGSAAATPLVPLVHGNENVASDPRVSPDDLHVVYRADAVTDGVQELFSVPLDGSSAPVRLNGNLAAGESVQFGFEFNPAGTRVFFTAGTSAANVLHVARIDGSTAALALDAEPSTSKTELRVGPSGVRALYEKTSDGKTTLWSVRTDGSSAPVVLSEGTVVSQFSLIANGAVVLYVSDDDDATVQELFARNPNGLGGRTQVNAEFPRDHLAGAVSAFQVAGDQAVYRASVDPSGLSSLFSVPIAGNRAPICISVGPGLPIDVQSTSATLAVGAGGTRAVFLGKRSASLELFSVPVDGSAPSIVLSGPMPPGGGLSSFLLSADGSTVVYLADQETNDVFELYRVAVDGSVGPDKLNGALVPGGDVVAGFRPSPNGTRVLYVADQDTDTKFELYSADGLAAPVKLSGSLIAVGDVQSDLLLSADGAWVFYRADATVDARLELFRAPSDGSASALALSGSIVSGGQVASGFRVTPDASRVLFLADREVHLRTDLYSVPADGSAAPLRLNSGGDANSDVFSVLLDPAGTRAVFHFDPALQPALLFSVPIDGSAPQTLLTPIASDRRVYGLEEGNGLPAIQISPDGTRVVYLSNQEVLSTPELYSAPLDGSALPILLDGPSGTLSRVRSFRIDPNGKRVVYTAEEGGNGVDGIYEVPIDRRHEPVLLSPVLTALNQSVVTDYTFGPEGATVLYRIDSAQVFSFDLYAAELDPRVRHKVPTR